MTGEIPRTLYDVLDDLALLLGDLGKSPIAIERILPAPIEWTDSAVGIYFISRALMAMAEKGEALISEAYQLAPNEKDLGCH